MSNAVIGNLRVNLGIDTATFAAGAKQAQTTLAGLQRSIQGFGVGVAGILGGLGLNALGSSVVQAMRDVAQIGDLAETIGVTAEQIQVFNRMALASGASTEAMARGLQEIAEQSTDANSKLSQLFAANGIAVQGRETNAVIRDFMTLLQNARTPTEQLAMATSVLGTRVGRELVEALRTGAQGYDEATRSMVESGNYHSNAEVERLQKIEEQYNKVAANIATRWQQMVVKLAEGAAYLTLALDPILNPDFSKPTAAGELFRYLTGGKTDPNFGKQALPSGMSLKDLGSGADRFFYQPQTVNMGPMGGPGQFAPVKPTVLPPDKDKTDAVRQSITQAVTPPPIKIPVLPDSIDDIYGYGPAVTQFAESATEANAAAQGLTNTLASGLSSSLTGIAFGADSASTAMEMLKRTALNTLQNITEQLLNSGLNMLLSGMGGGKFSGMLGGFGGFFASGGALGAGKWGIAGEAGPEIIHGPARITPMDGGRRGGITVNNNVVNNSSATVETRATENRDGSIDIETLVEEKVVSTLAGGRAAKVMGTRYGSRVTPKRT